LSESYQTSFDQTSAPGNKTSYGVCDPSSSGPPFNFIRRDAGNRYCLEYAYFTTRISPEYHVDFLQTRKVSVSNVNSANVLLATVGYRKLPHRFRTARRDDKRFVFFILLYSFSRYLIVPRHRCLDGSPIIPARVIITFPFFIVVHVFPLFARTCFWHNIALDWDATTLQAPAFDSTTTTTTTRTNAMLSRRLHCG